MVGIWRRTTHNRLSYRSSLMNLLNSLFNTMTFRFPRKARLLSTHWEKGFTLLREERG
jgi:hypothetical protein